MIKLKSILLEYNDQLKIIVGVTKEDGDYKSFGSDSVVNHSVLIDRYHHKIKDIIDEYYLSWRYNPNDQYLYWWETPNNNHKESAVHFITTNYPKYKIIGHRLIHGQGDKKLYHKMFYASHGYQPASMPTQYDKMYYATHGHYPGEMTEEVQKNDVSTFEKCLRDKYPQLEELFLSLHSNGALFIHSVRVKKEERQKGIGRKVMEEIKQFADKHGLVITLSPEAESRYKAKLDKFYKDLGFSHNAGRKKDYRYSSFFGKTMIRRPGVNEYDKIK